MSVPLLLATLLLSGFRQPEIAFSAGLHSYEQLAAELTHQGIPVRCDGRIRWRYALVRMPAMTWDRLRPLLQSALRVHFDEAGDGYWDLKRDPSEATTEDVLLRRFSSKFDRTISDAVQSGWTIRQRWDLGLPTTSRSDAFENVLESIRSLPAGNPDRNTLAVAVSLKDDQMSCLAFSEIWNGVDFTRLIKQNPVTLMTVEDAANWKSEDNPIGRSLLKSTESFPQKFLAARTDIPPVSIEAWLMDLRRFALSHYVLTLSGLAQPRTGVCITPIVPDTIGFNIRWEDLYHGLSQQKAFRQRTADTAAYVGRDAASKRFTLPRTESTVSSLFDAWSKATGQPLIMEVAPARDALYDEDIGRETNTTLRDFLSGIAGEDMTPACLRAPWTIQEVDGVTIVADELGFVDHLTQPNPNAAIELANRRRSTSLGVNKIDDLFESCAQIAQDECVASVRTGLYGGLAQTPYAIPYLQLIASDPASLRRVKAILPGDRLELRLVDFPLSARRSFGKVLTQLGLPIPSFLWTSSQLPEFESFLKTAAIVVSCQSNGDTMDISFVLHATEGQAYKPGYCPVLLGPLVPGQ
ncbi:MAG: hypothetical protein P4L46_05610 [Fimbriimonas sp.]|nr:hypothetical protein [Fimbriimonas sp.]